MQLWKLRSPMTCCLQAGGPREPVVEFQSKPKPENRGSQRIHLVQVQRPKNQDADVQEQEKMDVPAQAKSKFTLSPHFLSIQALNRLDDAHLHW